MSGTVVETISEPVDLAGTLEPLNASHRCDRCQAQAYYAVQFKVGGELLFCAHHFKQGGDKLRALASGILDESHLLTQEESEIHA